MASELCKYQHTQNEANVCTCLWICHCGDDEQKVCYHDVHLLLSLETGAAPNGNWHYMSVDAYIQKQVPKWEQWRQSLTVCELCCIKHFHVILRKLRNIQRNWTLLVFGCKL